MKLPSLLSAALIAFCAVQTSLVLAEDVSRQADVLEAEAAAEASKLVPKSVHVVELDKSAFRQLLKDRDEIVVEFYANWCSACHGVSPEFNAFADAAHKKHPNVVVGRVDITQVEYLSSSFMISMLPELIYIRRPAPGTTPEVRYASANISKDALLDYVGGGWLQDKPIGGYRTLWCTPTNLCGHIGGLTGEAVVSLDARFNIFNMSPWAFMAIVTTIIYLVGQMLVGYIGGLTRRAYRTKIYKKYDDAPSVVPPSDRSLDHGDANGSGGQPSKSQGSAAKRSKSKRSKSD